MFGLLPKCTTSAVRQTAGVSAQSHDLAGLTVTSGLYGQLVTQSLDPLWSGTDWSLLGPNCMLGDAFRMTLSLLQRPQPFSRTLENYAGTLLLWIALESTHHLSLPQTPLAPQNFPGHTAHAAALLVL